MRTSDLYFELKEAFGDSWIEPQIVWDSYITHNDTYKEWEFLEYADRGIEWFKPGKILKFWIEEKDDVRFVRTFRDESIEVGNNIRSISDYEEPEEWDYEDAWKWYTEE